MTNKQTVKTVKIAKDNEANIYRSYAKDRDGWFCWGWGSRLGSIVEFYTQRGYRVEVVATPPV